ncbi:nucleotidyltransferase [Parapedobacter defluvii]|uniref:Nucleotidyltransferase n=1 Tax=Parapedobacter defluvii TaxID=2045106 RepID=A0ABQ1LQV0_9SPHI|nr:sugar phosphate nucleotidyltransferase [Parapedobacter defluvii]RQP10464.1 MAG: nucleotidyltransferase [Parapedobacter sp.]GGC27455.1 nucleotidyltransferase [Parapedobacter defluvii]
MSKPTLLILAAGMASRYGSMKQIDPFGPNGETIIDYSIYDAIRAGFGKVSFIIREEFAEKFKEIFEPKLAGKIETDYVYQSYDLTPFGIDRQIERSKPWGTAHAVLSARNQIHEPFCVINADDFYGYEAFEKMAKFLTDEVADDKFSLMGYQIDKTLSDYGSVSRGVCKVDDQGNMTEINERLKVYFKEVDGEKRIFFEEDGVETELPRSSRVSMNFWGFTPAIFGVSEELFKAFVPANEDNPKSEFLIPKVADELIQQGKATFKVLPTSQKWFGVTYPEDKPIVQENIARLVKDGIYPEKLF